MARPRIFVSSTYFDLKHIRASLDVFIQSLGYESVLSEKGDIAYSHDRPLDQSCYREAETADIFVLIVGGRYGAEASGSKKVASKNFYDRYDSITKKEYEAALDRDVPTYILIEAGVHAEYMTYQRNKENRDISYAHVDSVNIFKLIDDISSKPRNNPIKTFEKYGDIETWLKDQWAGLFRDLINKRSEQQQLNALSAQVGQLAEVSKTLKSYLEAVVEKTVENPGVLIHSEQARLKNAKAIAEIEANRWFKHINDHVEVTVDQLAEVLRAAPTPASYEREMANLVGEELASSICTLLDLDMPREDIDEIRQILGLAPYEWSEGEGGVGAPKSDKMSGGRKGSRRSS